jgi:isoleucyl-tRNA synthetase
VVDELRFLLISGDVTIVDDASATAIGVTARATAKPKCVRCWQRRADVGAHAEHAELCGRCVENIATDGRDGQGELRRWF